VVSRPPVTLPAESLIHYGRFRKVLAKLCAQGLHGQENRVRICNKPPDAVHMPVRGHGGPVVVGERATQESPRGVSISVGRLGELCSAQW
jgi:hypothetical protein